MSRLTLEFNESDINSLMTYIYTLSYIHKSASPCVLGYIFSPEFTLMILFKSERVALESVADLLTMRVGGRSRFQTRSWVLKEDDGE